MVIRTRFFSASLSSVTLQRLGRKRRLVRRLAWLTLLPVSTALPVSSQRRAMALILLLKSRESRRCFSRVPEKRCNQRRRYTGMGLSGQGAATNLRQARIDESCKYPDIRAWVLAGGADLLGVGAMQRARHCLSLAAVAALTCGLGGNFP